MNRIHTTFFFFYYVNNSHTHKHSQCHLVVECVKRTAHGANQKRIDIGEEQVQRKLCACSNLAVVLVPRSLSWVNFDDGRVQKSKKAVYISLVNLFFHCVG